MNAVQDTLASLTAPPKKNSAAMVAVMVSPPSTSSAAVVSVASNSGLRYSATWKLTP